MVYLSVFTGLLGLCIGQYFYFAAKSYRLRSLCPVRSEVKYQCLDKYQNFGLWLSLISFFVLVILVIMFIVSEPRIRVVWKKFTFWFIPLAIIITLVSPGSCGGSISSLLCWSQEWSVMFFSVVYISVSILILIIKSWKLRKENKANELPIKTQG